MNLVNSEKNIKKKTADQVDQFSLEKKNIFIGRRKEAVSRVIIKKGDGNILVNNKKAEDYFYMDKNLVEVIKTPLKLFNKEVEYSLFIKVSGGGFSSQAGASRLAVARFLLEDSKDYRFILKKNKLLTRDPRAKERRKPGLLKARKRPPFVKR